jgi:GAF domain-containing protein
MNPRELVACAEAAMMTAKARGKDQTVLFGEETRERPVMDDERDLRSIAHLKMLQSLSGKLNRLNDVREIGLVIANELRSLIDYHNCRIYVVEGEMIVPIAFRGDLAAPPATSLDVLSFPVGRGVTGHVVQTGEALIVGDAARCEFAAEIPGTDAIDESLLAVPLRHGTRRIGAIVISKLGFDQFDDDDLRLVQVLAAQVAAAVENARLYEAQCREAASAQALLAFARALSSSRGLDDVLQQIVEQTMRIVEAAAASVWLADTPAGGLRLGAVAGRPDLAAALDAELLRGRVSAPSIVEQSHPALASTRTLVAPFELSDGVCGCIAAHVEARSDDPLERRLAVLDELAHQARLAIANARSYDRLEATLRASNVNAQVA